MHGSAGALGWLVLGVQLGPHTLLRLAQAVRHPRVEPLLMDAVAFAKLPPEEMRYSHALFTVSLKRDGRGGALGLAAGRVV